MKKRTDLFAGTAAYYAAYRRDYPQPVVDYLVDACGLDGRGRLLDGGCGTGQVFRPMARYFEEVLAIDSDAGMVEYARRAAVDAGLDHVQVRRMRAEELDGDSAGPLRMAIFGASFHWMDRPRVGTAICQLIEPGGDLAVISPGGFHSGNTDWEAEIIDALHRHIGPERRAGSGLYVPGERHEEALRKTPFDQITVHDIPVVEPWTIDQIMGCLYSTSYASKAVLGDRAGSFEEDLRKRLRALSPGGRFEKVTEYTVILAQR